MAKKKNTPSNTVITSEFQHEDTTIDESTSNSKPNNTKELIENEANLEDSQENVTGKVFVKLLPYRFELQGIESEHDLMKSGFGDYGETVKAWTADDVKGFTKIMSNSLKIYHKVNKKS